MMTIYLELYFTLNNTSDKVHCKLGILTKMIAVPLVACSTSVKKAPNQIQNLHIINGWTTSKTERLREKLR